MSICLYSWYIYHCSFLTLIIEKKKDVIILLFNTEY